VKTRAGTITIAVEVFREVGPTCKRCLRKVYRRRTRRPGTGVACALFGLPLAYSGSGYFRLDACIAAERRAREIIEAGTLEEGE
jgi:hypothetical protein